MVLRFGKIVAVETEPGLHFKQPFVDNVVRFDKRILLYDIEPEKIIAADKKTLVIDTYVLWRIKDAEAFIKSLKSVKLALPRIDDVVYSHVRNIFAKANFDEIISEKREDLLREVTALSREDLKDFGIEVVDVRVKHADLPAENEKAVYERMKAERYSIAAQIRAEGEKEARKIRAEADKTAKVLIAEAQSKAEQIKGTGEASAVKIYAEVFSKDKDFYEFWRTMEVYRSIEKGILIIGDELDALKYLKTK
ncbi:MULTISPECIES: protease modulator HflC [unclassified Thermotoga]|uniref:protease modulator HflC n=1 Tax=unclassified Thermotoga TaxID=2631113 RepID=UPI00054423EC|nr:MULTISPECIES: protease modulator HflC [unclassified Thermotoga]KHC95486.1 HflC protein [Thermotoga sp. TBGT1765]KHC95799.1 HflC protein [Thermotoga sp. TBGT1766]KHC96991.1 HflC protein [Thermotoga sp. Xyl54]